MRRCSVGSREYCSGRTRWWLTRKGWLRWVERRAARLAAHRSRGLISLTCRKAARWSIRFIVTKIMGTTLSLGDRAERTIGSIVSANYFDAIGVHPILGRGFARGEDVGSNAHPVTVISYQLWQSRFKGDPAIIGKTQTLERNRTHHRGCGAGRIPGDVRGLGDAVLGSGIDGRNI